MDDKKVHDHLEIHALIDGGYVIREGRFDSDGAGRQSEWNWRQERAAFATLADALAWLGGQMVNKAPDLSLTGKGKSR